MTIGKKSHTFNRKELSAGGLFRGGKTMRDYLNLPDLEFDQFFKGLNQYVGQKCAGGANAEWKHIPAESQQDMQGGLYQMEYGLYENDWTPYDG